MSGSAGLTSAQIVAVAEYMGYAVRPAPGGGIFAEPVFQNTSPFPQSLETVLGSLTSDQLARITGFYLPQLALRQQEVQDASQNLDTDQAAVWKHNKQELSDRQELYLSLRRDLCVFLGFTGGAALSAGMRLQRF